MALFDDHADTYDNFCQTPLGHYVDTVEHGLIADLAQPRPGERAIDLGCGTGAYTLWLNDVGTHVTGVDVSRRMLEVAGRKCGGVPLIQADLRKLPFPDGTFDIALCNLALEFIEKPAEVMAEIYRILKPGGRLIAGFIGKCSPWAQKYIRRGQEDPTSVYHGAHFFTYTDIKELGWGDPVAARFGLYVSPELFDIATAWDIERAHGQFSQEMGAGFIAVRWEK